MAPASDEPLQGQLSLESQDLLRTSRARWHILALYMTLGLVNQSCWLTFSTVSAESAYRYSVTEDWITAQTTSVTVLFLPGAWLCSKILSQASLREAVILSAALQAAGGVLRWAADQLLRPFSPQVAFGVIFLGQDLTALAAPAFMNTPAVLTEDWFPAGERESALSAAIFSPVVGQGLGGALSGFLAGGDTGNGLRFVLLGQAVAFCLLLLWTSTSFRAKPPVPPSVAAQIGSDSQVSVIRTWARLLCRPQFLLVLCIFASGTSVASAALTLYGQLAGGCGYKSWVAGAANGLYISWGVVGACITGRVMGKTRAYRTCLRCTVTAAVLSGVLFLLCLRPDSVAGLLIATAIFGMTLMGCMPVLVTNAVEETYPLPADASTSLLFVVANLLQILVTPLMQRIIDVEPNKCGGLLAPSRIFVLSLAFFGCQVPAMLYRGECRRKLAEDQAASR